MSRMGLLIVALLAASHALSAQDVTNSVNLTVARAADEIDSSQISRDDALKITATFIETQAARNALKKALEDYVHSIEHLDETHANQLSRLLTESDGQLRIMHCATSLSAALDDIQALANEFTLLAPDAAGLATDYGAGRKSAVADEAAKWNLHPPSKEKAVALLQKMQANDSAFDAAYIAFCSRMEKKFGFAFVAEASQIALRQT